jgi:hypothetical protein
MKPDYKSLSRGNSRDMSPGAINSRLDKVADLYELWKLLRTAKRSKVRETPAGASQCDLTDGPDSGSNRTGTGNEPEAGFRSGRR